MSHPSVGACHLLVLLHLVLPLPLVMSITLRETEGACDMNQELQSESGSYNVSPVCI